LLLEAGWVLLSVLVATVSISLVLEAVEVP
jgi:hypothetical protein